MAQTLSSYPHPAPMIANDYMKDQEVYMTCNKILYDLTYYVKSKNMMVARGIIGWRNGKNRKSKSTNFQ